MIRHQRILRAVHCTCAGEAIAVKVAIELDHITATPGIKPSQRRCAPGATRCSDCLYASCTTGVNAALLRIPSSVIAKKRAAYGQPAVLTAASTAAAAVLAGQHKRMHRQQSQ